MRTIVAALVLAAALFPRAEATAFAGVKEAFWQTGFAYYDDLLGHTSSTLPPGVVVECAGAAALKGDGCWDQEGVSVFSHGPLKHGHVDAFGDMILRNESAVDYPGRFVFKTDYSSFNPGGPDIGASVEYPVREFASFFTVVTGPGMFDLHGCAITGGHSDYSRAAKVSCGVSSPDSNTIDAVVGPLMAGETIRSAYRIYIDVFAKGADPVPEPATLAFLLTGLITLRQVRVCRRKVRSPFR